MEMLKKRNIYKTFLQLKSYFLLIPISLRMSSTKF